MKEFWKIVRSKYKDPKIALWMKMVLMILLLFNFCAGIFYPARRKAEILAILLVMALLLAVNCLISRKKTYSWLDGATFLLLFTPNLHLFYRGNIGYFSLFYLMLFSMSAVFILGIRTSLWFNAGAFLFVLLQLRGKGFQRLLQMYNENLLLRFPYLYLCIIGISYIIMYSIQKYWVEKEESRQILEKRIATEKKKLADMSLDVITSMYSALSAKIPEIDRHCEQTAVYSREMAERMGLDEKACTNAYYAGLLHEVGAVGLPDEVIQKSSLTEEQYKIYQTYVFRGYKIIRELQIADEVAEAILYHRENYDGTGYLEGRFGKNIPLLSRILAAADYADRHARWGETTEEVCRKIEERKGKRFDPECARKICEILRKDSREQNRTKIV